ncbi:MAG: condensin subunit MukF [Pseudomonadota bacterium]
MSNERPDPHRTLRALRERNARLELDTPDLCFLAALYLKARDAQLSAFDEAALVEVFEQVVSVIEPQGSAQKRRASAAIRRLREQRLLTRVDGVGVVRAGEYALTRLATAVVAFFLEDESLTRESLTLLTRSLLGSLESVLEAARVAATAEDWARTVVAPLRITIAELLSGIERRQRGFDLEQEGLQRAIAELITADWFGAIDRCQEMLEATSKTLRELNQVLLHDTHEIQSRLQEIHELAADAGQEEAALVVRATSDQIDRVAAWGSARQRAWSEYYQYVHRYLREVVRIDPTRMLVHRLREQLAGRAGRPYALTVAAAPSMQLLRPVELLGERPPVKRRRKPAEPDVVDVDAVDPERELERSVRTAVAEGADCLSAVTRRLTTGLDADQRFGSAGRVAQAVARVCRAEAGRERPWVAVDDTLLIEEWVSVRTRESE